MKMRVMGKNRKKTVIILGLGALLLSPRGLWANVYTKQPAVSTAAGLAAYQVVDEGPDPRVVEAYQNIQKFFREGIQQLDQEGRFLYSCTWVKPTPPSWDPLAAPFERDEPLANSLEIALFSKMMEAFNHFTEVPDTANDREVLKANFGTVLNDSRYACRETENAKNELADLFGSGIFGYILAISADPASDQPPRFPNGKFEKTAAPIFHKTEKGWQPIVAHYPEKEFPQGECSTCGPIVVAVPTTPDVPSEIPLQPEAPAVQPAAPSRITNLDPITSAVAAEDGVQIPNALSGAGCSLQVSGGGLLNIWWAALGMLLIGVFQKLLPTGQEK